MQEIISSLKIWILHLFEVHCSDCSTCQNCEYLKQLLDIEKHRVDELIYRIGVSPDIKEPEVAPEFQAVKRAIPWKVKQQMLEERSRFVANKLKEGQSIEDLENELLGNKGA